MLGLLTGLFMTANINLYPRAMEIVEIDTKANEVVCVDALGHEWGFYGSDNLSEGDLVICMIDTKGTDTFSDDEIVDVWWSGYTTQNLYKPLCMRAIDI